ncbi:putative Ig domain-containing protein [Pseudoalteromonas rubra]|uniref:putative Ig domain-containing protein n=1 Tax=Pseudoalteromonas rubra TaxID=43658 RepID=UPI000F778586|nr:Ig-like domain-containing protein [Pseudoalteromonas rubra]
MKPINTASVLLFALIGASGCGSSGDNHLSSGSAADKVQIQGAVEKGPFVVGSTVTINKLSEQGQNTGVTIVTNTTNDLGHFDFSAGTGDLLQITSTGYYRNEITGELSSDTVTLRSLYKVGEDKQQRANVNLLTHLTSIRALALLKSGELTFQEAIAQAENEFKNTFKQVISAPEGDSFASVSIFNSADNNDSAYLLSISALMYQYALNTSTEKSTASEAELTLLINELEEDFGADGKIDDDEALAVLQATHKYIDPVTVTNNAKKWISEQSSLTVPDINLYLDSDLDGITNASDSDDDNDGIVDEQDTDPYTAALISEDQSLTVVEDNALTIEVQSNLPLETGIFLEILKQPVGGLVTGVFPELTYQPHKDFNGEDEFTFVLQQGDLRSREVKVSITVTGVNDAPQLTGPSHSTAKAQELFTYTPVAIDPEQSVLTFKVKNLPDWASFDEHSGEISGTPSNSAAGLYEEIVISATDGELSAELPALSIQVLYSELSAPGALKAEHTEVGNGRYDVAMTWEEVEYATAYEVQTASEPSFSSPIYSEQIEGTAFGLQKGVGNYFWRVRSVNPDAVAGAWSEVAEMKLGVFSASFGGSRDEQFRQAIATQDKGYLVVASTYSPEISASAGAKNVGWLIKVSNKGVKEWQYTIPESSFSNLRDATELSDGSFIIIGRDFVVKLDQQGKLQWRQDFPESAGTKSSFTAVSEVNGKLYVGKSMYESAEFHESNSDLLILSTESGEIIETKQLPMFTTNVPSDLDISAIKETKSGELFVAGSVGPREVSSPGDYYRHGGAFFMVFNSEHQPVTTWHNAGTGTHMNVTKVLELDNGSFFFLGQSVSKTAYALVSSEGLTIDNKVVEAGFSVNSALFEHDGFIYGTQELVLNADMALSRLNTATWHLESVQAAPNKSSVLKNNDGTVTLAGQVQSGDDSDIIVEKVKLQ